MGKRLAVLVRERQEEALRVAVGLTLGDNRVEVFILDRKLAPTAASSAFLEALRDLETPVATTCADNEGIELVSNAELARRIVACDHVLAY